MQFGPLGKLVGQKMCSFVSHFLNKVENNVGNDSIEKKRNVFSDLPFELFIQNFDSKA